MQTFYLCMCGNTKNKKKREPHDTINSQTTDFVTQKNLPVYEILIAQIFTSSLKHAVSLKHLREAFAQAHGGQKKRKGKTTKENQKRNENRAESRKCRCRPFSCTPPQLNKAARCWLAENSETHSESRRTKRNRNAGSDRNQTLPKSIKKKHRTQKN